MSKKIIPIVVLLTLIIGCQDQPVIDNAKTIPRSVAPPELRVLTPASGYQFFTDTYNAIRSNPSGAIVTIDGKAQTNFAGLSLPYGMQFLNDIVLVNNGDENMTPQTPAQLRAEVVVLLRQFAWSRTFNETILNFFDWMNTYLTQTPWHTTLLQMDVYISYSSSTSGLSAAEKFTLVQMFTNLKHVTQYFIKNPLPEGRNGRTSAACLPKTREQWKDIAWEAFKTGIKGGLATGLVGIRMGALATTAAGNPIVGGIVGGAIGFTMGFVGGAMLGGGTKILFECLFNQVVQWHIPVHEYSCNGNVRKSHTPLPGCTEIPTEAYTGNPYVFYDNYVRGGIMKIKDLPLYANVGSSFIDITLERNIKDVLTKL